MADKPKAFQVMYDYSDVATLKTFAMCNKRVRGVMGPFGSGKSSAMVMEIIKRAHEQEPGPDGIRRTRWAVVRNCYDDQTEILTEKRGWQLFRKLLPTDKVATLDGDQIIYKLPEGVAKHQYQGDMIGYDGEGIDFLVTPEHEMWVSKRRTRKKVWGEYEAAYAKDIYGSQTVRVRRDSKWIGTPTDLSPAVYEWLGFWFAEGSYCVTTGNSRRCVITQCKPEGKKYAIDLFARAGLGLRTQYEGSNHFGLRLKDSLAEKIISLVSDSGLAVNKKIPYEIKNAPAKHLRAFLHGYIMGDGCTAGGATRIYTSSKVMADDLQEICIKAGYVSNLSSRDRRGNELVINGVKTKSTSEEYCLTILCPKKYRPVLKVNPKHTNHLKGWYKKPYDGFVYCVEMEKVPVCVRRNGKHFWCLRSFPQLKDTTIRTFHDWFPPKMFGEYRISDHNYIITAFPGCHIEIMFRALDRPDQIANLLSLEITGAWINEAREIPKSIFMALDGRIGRYPSARDGGCTWMGIFMDTNPPDSDSWWHTLFEKKRPPNAQVFKQPSGLSPHAENTTHLPKNYYQNLALGKDEMYLRVYIHGQYGYMIDGEPVFKSFKDNIHVASHPPEPVKGRELLVGFDFALCYDDQTEVMTKAGWKYFKNVSDEDLIMTKNFETNLIEYHKPSRRVAVDYSGDMYLYENHNVNFCVTPDHIIPCRKRYGRKSIYQGDNRIPVWKLHNDINKHYAVDLTARWVGNSLGVFGPLDWDSKTFSEFMGLYLSEGSCDKVNNRISIAQDRNDEVFQVILDNTKLKWIRSKKCWRTSNQVLNDYLKQFGYAKEKYVPNEIKGMSSEDIRHFIMSYTRGDGNIRTAPNGSERHTIFTISKRMADDLQELALKAGWYAKIRVTKPQKSNIIENGKVREISNQGGYEITFKKRAIKSQLTKQYMRKVNYQGEVYCVTVPNGTLYVRRKWTPSWNGNCPTIVLGQIHPRGQLVILDEIISDGMGLKQFCNNLLLPLLRTKYHGFKVMGYGDPSGSSRSPTDETTCFDILHSSEIGLNYIVPANTNALVPRIGAVESFLNKLVDGEPGFVLSPDCHTLRKAMNGAYHYELIPGSKTGQHKEKPSPCKDDYSHVADALQMLCLYIDEKDENDKRHKAFMSQIQRPAYQVADSMTGY